MHSSQVEHTLLSLAPMHITGNVWGLWIYGLTHMRGGAGVEGGGREQGGSKRKREGRRGMGKMKREKKVGQSMSS